MSRTFHNFRLALRLLARDWRAGELRLFVAALVIAVGAVSAVGFFTDRVARGLTVRSAEMLGADLVLLASNPAPDDWIAAAERGGVASAQAVEFASGIVRGERVQLVGVRAVGPGYPPRGTVRTARDLYQSDEAMQAPSAAGTAWAEARVLQELNIRIGESINIGDATLTVTRVLTDEPGRALNFFALAPRVLIPLGDVARTHVIQPGSRVTYRYAFSGPPAAIQAFETWLRPRLRASDQLTGARTGNPATARSIERTERYLGLTSLLAVLLAGVAIGMAARRYSARHYDMTAMLRALGSTQRDILELYLPQFVVLGTAAAAFGCIVGLGAQAAILAIVRDLLPMPLPSPGAQPALFGFAAGFITLAGFALVPILRLRAVPPLRVLRREAAPLPVSAWTVIGAAAAALVVLMWRHSGDFLLTFGVLAAAGLAAAVLYLLTWLLLRFARARPGTGSFWSEGLRRLQRRTHASTGQILAFGLTLMAMAVIALVRTDLLATWREQLPADAPNHFIFNIQPGDAPAIETFFRANAIRTEPLYPVVRGRLVAVNGTPAAQRVKKDEGSDADEAALRRDLNLTWAAQAPSDNAVVRGEWWGANAPTRLVSVEEKIAERLGIELGDTIGFDIGGTLISARVTSVRRVKWETFHPNFFVIFSPGSLDDFPATYMTSFYLTDTQRPLLGNIVRQFPAATVLELEQFLTQLRRLVAQASSAVELVLLFVLAAGLTVLYAALAASLDERFYEGALLRTFGATRRQLWRSHWVEFVTLGVAAGVLAAGGAELIAYVLYTRVFDIVYTPKWPVWILAPLAGGVLIGVAGFVGTRRVVERSPLTVLREI
ncbi:MAG: ABC transporter permease [Sulfurifustis sp.]